MSSFAVPAQNQPVSQPERRVYERVPISIFGRCMFENKLEIPCQTINMSPGDLAAVAGHLPRVNENLIVYLDNIGRVEGNVVRLFEGGFAMVLNGSERMREKLESKILWYKENAQFGGPESREHERIVPRQPVSEIRLPDGRAYSIEIIDISLSGAAVKSDVRPAMGTMLTLGGMQGYVVRHFDEGIAIEFASSVDSKNLEKKFI